MPRRISQRNIKPTAIKARHTGALIQRSGSAARASATVSTGSGVTFTATASNTAGKRLLGNIDRATYIGSAATANELPGGSSVTEGDYQVIGPYLSLTRTDGNNLKEVLYIGNNSGASKTFISDIRARALIDQGGAL